jgi:hypothetical protein
MSEQTPPPLTVEMVQAIDAVARDSFLRWCRTPNREAYVAQALRQAAHAAVQVVGADLAAAGCTSETPDASTPTDGLPQPTQHAYRWGRANALTALDEEPELTRPGDLVRQRISDAVVESTWPIAYAAGLAAGRTAAAADPLAEEVARAAVAWRTALGTPGVDVGAAEATLFHLAARYGDVLAALKG